MKPIYQGGVVHIEGDSYELDFEAIGRVQLDDGPKIPFLEAVLREVANQHD